MQSLPRRSASREMSVFGNLLLFREKNQSFVDKNSEMRLHIQNGNSANAEDALQEALLDAYKHRPVQGQIADVHVADHDCPRLRAVATSQTTAPNPSALDEQIRAEQKSSAAEQLADPIPSPEDQSRNSELVAHLRTFRILVSAALQRTFQLREYWRERLDSNPRPPA